MTDISHTERQAGARDARTGVLLGLCAFSLWGFYALYFKQLAHINPAEVVAHRAFWSVPFAGIILFAMGRTGDIARAFRSPRILGLLCITTLLVTINWGFFVWAVAVDRTLEASLGYYINPLLNVLIGFALLGERFSLAQRVAISLAVLAVIIMTFSVGVFPWLPLLLGGSFATYGYIRKTMDVGPVQGFFVESVLLSVMAVAILVWLSGSGETLYFATSAKDTVLLISCGPMTAMPLMLFAAAARRLRLSTLGLLQYIAPTGLFLTGVFVFAEPIGWGRLITFLLIWSALAIYSFEALRLDRSSGR
jgi:chloramphenicol-sensitive protein RarD